MSWARSWRAFSCDEAGGYGYVISCADLNFAEDRKGQVMENTSMDLAVQLGRDALFTVLQLSMPLLLVGLVVGLAVSLVQAVTQIQEQTLSFVPKILAVVGILFALLPWMIFVIVSYTENLFSSLDRFFRPM